VKLSELHGRRLVIWGAGREGRSAADLFARSSAITIVSDRGDDDAGAVALAAELGSKVMLPTPEVLGANDFIIRAPGVSKYRPELLTAAAHGVASASLFALWLADSPSRHVIGVTGTKGKSTTSSLIHQLLVAHGVDAQLGGNIGIAVTDLPDAQWYVVEVSSYQGADCTTSPTIGVLTTLDADHLPWHGSVQQYRADKLNLFAHDELRTLIVNSSDATAVRESAVLAAAVNRRVLVAPMVGDVQPGSGAMSTVALSEVLQRSHNRSNVAVAIAAVEHALGRPCSPDALSEVLSVFGGLPARQQQVGVIDGVRYIDDAIASNPLAVCAALDVFDHAPLLLIMGGADRHVDLTPLIERLGRCPSIRGLIAMGPLGQRLADEVAASGLTGVTTRQMWVTDDNVARAVAQARDLSGDGDIVLFSPAAPTTPDVGTYLERSALFRDAVAQLPARAVPTNEAPM
jgi:UDP-N-acetylmuramoyl-L-alanine---L-glutamate ligase